MKSSAQLLSFPTGISINAQGQSSFLGFLLPDPVQVDLVSTLVPLHRPFLSHPSSLVVLKLCTWAKSPSPPFQKWESGDKFSMQRNLDLIIERDS